MSEVKVNKITPTANCGTVTLGDSGDTFTIPSGVTLSSAGSITNSGTITNTGTISGGTITGTIDGLVSWDTTAKTTGFTAVAGNGYFVNTTSGAITVTLPATPTAGDLVGIKDYANTADTNNITIDRNGSNIQGVANNYVISIEGLAITLIYVDGTQGWVSTGAAQASDITAPTFITATGGTITTCGNYKIHTFTGPGTFTVCSVGNPSGGPNNVDYLVVAGGGSGGNGTYWGGGGGAGGYRTSFPSPVGTIPVTAQGYPITVGAGGSAGGNGSSGSNSIFSTITSAGGGVGGTPATGLNGVSGGSGGGAGASAPNTVYSGGSGNTPPVSPPQGNSGGANGASGYYQGTGGGGGAGGTGGNGNPSTAGPGGNGLANSITGTPVLRGGGGGGGSNAKNESNPAILITAGSGGPGGGGRGAARGPGYSPVSQTSAAGTANTGGGGGGAGGDCYQGSGGGSGVVIIRYKYQ